MSAPGYPDTNDLEMDDRWCLNACKTYAINGNNRPQRGQFAPALEQLSVASPEGLEPPTHVLEGHCSIRMSYGLTVGHFMRRIQSPNFDLPTLA